MAIYLYKAVKEGKVLKGEVEAKNKKEVASILFQQDLQILSIDQKNIFNSPNELLNVNIGGIPTKERTIFLRQLAYMIEAGLPINQALETITGQIKNAQFKKVIKEVMKEVQEGGSLSQAFAKHDKVFDKVIINLVKAGEESGKLDEILDRLAYDYEKKQEFAGKVRGALIYPLVLFVIIIGVIALLMVVMIPSIKSLYAEGSPGGKKKELPFVTQIMIGISDFFTNYWWAIIIAIIIFVLGFRYYQKTPSGKALLDSFYIKIPIFGNLIKLSQIAQFARSLSMLLKSGVPIIKSMELVAESLNNQVFSDEINSATKKLEKGVVLSQSISKDSPFTQMVFQMLSIGEQTGKTDSTLGKLAEYYEREVDQITSNLTKIMEPIILVIMGVIVLGIALAVYLPVYTFGS